MVNERVLVVDDEPVNLAVIEDALADSTLLIETFIDPLQAWARLHGAADEISLVILDRRMPQLDGIEFIDRMKADARLAGIPVIMQTAASAPEEIREGLAAGVYYYLTKPYDLEALATITRAALEDSRQRQRLVSREVALDTVRRLAQVMEYEFATLDDVAALVPVLILLCPTPDAVVLGLSELMINAVEHGNLGVSYQEKSLLKWEGDWEREVNHRQSLPQFRDRRANVRVERLEDRIVFTITDQGPGFDWSKYLTFDPDRAFDPNGRGIAMAKAMSFATLEYQGCGNVVVATVLAPRSAPQLAPQS